MKSQVPRWIGAIAPVKSASAKSSSSHPLSDVLAWFPGGITMSFVGTIGSVTLPEPEVVHRREVALDPVGGLDEDLRSRWRRRYEIELRRRRLLEVPLELLNDGLVPGGLERAHNVVDRGVVPWCPGRSRTAVRVRDVLQFLLVLPDAVDCHGVLEEPWVSTSGAAVAGDTSSAPRTARTATTLPMMRLILPPLSLGCPEYTRRIRVDPGRLRHGYRSGAAEPPSWR